MLVNRKISKTLGSVLALVLASVSYLSIPPAQANTATGNTVIGNIAPASDANGYAWISYFRSLGGLGPVQRNATFEAEESLHVRYLANHSLRCENNVHDELITRVGSCGANPYATAAGRAAAQNSNVTRVNAAISDRAAVSNWFVSAFHALTLLEPRLRSTGYAAYYTPNPTGARPTAYQFTASVDVYRGRTGGYGGQTVAFPANGAASPLLSYQIGTESPEPFRSTLASSACHSWGAKSVVSAPIVMQWPLDSRAVQIGASILDLTTGKALPTCGLTAGQYPAGSLPSQFLLGTNRLTKAAFYYASTPFVAGHRYQLKIAGAPATTFSAISLLSLPAVTPTALNRGILSTGRWYFAVRAK